MKPRLNGQSKLEEAACPLPSPSSPSKLHSRSSSLRLTPRASKSRIPSYSMMADPAPTHLALYSAPPNPPITPAFSSQKQRSTPYSRPTTPTRLSPALRLPSQSERMLRATLDRDRSTSYSHSSSSAIPSSSKLRPSSSNANLHISHWASTKMPGDENLDPFGPYSPTSAPSTREEFPPFDSMNNVSVRRRSIPTRVTSGTAIAHSPTRSVVLPPLHRTQTSPTSTPPRSTRRPAPNPTSPTSVRTSSYYVQMMDVASSSSRPSTRPSSPSPYRSYQNDTPRPRPFKINPSAAPSEKPQSRASFSHTHSRASSRSVNGPSGGGYQLPRSVSMNSHLPSLPSEPQSPTRRPSTGTTATGELLRSRLEGVLASSSGAGPSTSGPGSQSHADMHVSSAGYFPQLVIPPAPRRLSSPTSLRPPTSKHGSGGDLEMSAASSSHSQSSGVPTPDEPHVLCSPSPFHFSLHRHSSSPSSALRAPLDPISISPTSQTSPISPFTLTPPPSPPSATSSYAFDATTACADLRARPGYASFADVLGPGMVVDDEEGENGVQQNGSSTSGNMPGKWWVALWRRT